MHENVRRRELSRRICDDHIALFILAAGPTVRIADGAIVGPRRPDHLHPQRPKGRSWSARADAGERGPAAHRGRQCAGLLVRRAVDADPTTGQRQWTDRTFVYSHFSDAELRYAVTDHVAQGRTVRTGLAVMTGTEDHQHAYVALTRGTDANHAYVFTISLKPADPVPGRAPLTPPGPWGAAMGMLAAIMVRDDPSRTQLPRPASSPSLTPTTGPPSGSPRRPRL